MGAFLVFAGQKIFIESIDEAFGLIIILIIFFAILTVLIIWNWELLLSKAFGKIKTKKENLEEDIEGIVKGILENNNNKVSNSTKLLSQKVIRFIAWREVKTSIFIVFQTLFILLGAIIGSVFIKNQNELIEVQNGLISKEIIRLDQQTYLQEAERRSTLVFLFSNIMDLLDKELKEDYNNDNIRNISPQLAGRIISLSQRLQPYKFLENDSLSSRAYSPERGQLLINLLKSDLSQNTLDELTKEGNFTSSNFSGVTFSNITVNDIDLSGSRFDKTEFKNVNFKSAMFNDCEFNNVLFDTTFFEFSGFENTYIGVSQKYNVEFNNCNLKNIHIKDNDKIYFDFVDSLKIWESNGEKLFLDGEFGVIGVQDSDIENFDFVGSANELIISKSSFHNTKNWKSTFKKFISAPRGSRGYKRFHVDSLKFDYFIFDQENFDLFSYLDNEINENKKLDYGFHGSYLTRDTIPLSICISDNMFEDNGIFNPYQAYLLFYKYSIDISNENFKVFLFDNLPDSLFHAIRLINSTGFKEDESSEQFYKRCRDSVIIANRIFKKNLPLSSDLYWRTAEDIISLEFYILLESKAKVEDFILNKNKYVALKKKMDDVGYKTGFLDEVKFTLETESHMNNFSKEYLKKIQKVYLSAPNIG